VDGLWDTVVCAISLVSKISNLSGPDPPTLQTDGRHAIEYRALHYCASRGKKHQNSWRLGLVADLTGVHTKPLAGTDGLIAPHKNPLHPSSQPFELRPSRPYNWLRAPNSLLTQGPQSLARPLLQAVIGLGGETVSTRHRHSAAML